MVYTKLGNGTETTYTYDKQRERLQVMNLTADGQTVMENRYRYDAVDNILGITNAANPTSLTKLNKAKLGGRSMHTYEYDELNRLIHANGKAKRASYDMVIWIQTLRPNTTPNTNPGPPVSWNDPTNPEDPQAGYGYIPNDTTKEETFFYHSDHLGSTSYITDDHTNITQYDAYLPYGELLVDEHSSSEDMPYKFNGKELDEETGLYYYGARYMDPKISMWLGVDPLMEKYTNVSGYVFCHSNPIVRIDRDGCADYFSISGKFIRSDKSKDKNIYIRTSSGNVLLSKYNFKRNLRAMMRITYHYAKEVGLEGKAKSIGVKSMKSNPEGELAITTYDNRIRVSTVNGHFKKSMDQIYNFRSTLAHEGFHIDTPNGVDEEVLVIMKEMSRKEFGKTTRSFKDNTAGYLQKELEKLYAVSGRNFYKVIGKAQKMLNKYGAKSSYEFIEGGNKIHF